MSSKSYTTQTDNSLAVSSADYVLGAGSKYTSPNSTQSQAGRDLVSTGNKTETTTTTITNNFSPEIRKVITDILTVSQKNSQAALNITDHVVSNYSKENIALLDGLIKTNASLNTTVLEAKIPETTYTKYIPYAIVAVVALMAIMVFGKR